jgi:mRNA interferase MazF
VPEKDYTEWMPVKAGINNRAARPPECRTREIWICGVGENVGFEEDGKGNGFRRPVLILKKHGKDFCHVVPLSTTSKRGFFYFPFDGHTGKTSVALLSQLRAVDTSRLADKVGYISVDDFEELKERMRAVLGL